ncbi:MAG: hypothetical protein ABI743_06185 [bacterium]
MGAGKSIHWLLACGALLLGLGCQGSGPIAAPSGTAEHPSAEEPVIALGDIAPGTGFNAAFGVWHGVVTPDGVNLTPLRTGSLIGDNWTVDVSQYFTQSPCTDCLKISNFGFYTGQLELDITVKHPFPDQILRADLDIFDPRLIVVSALDSELGSQIFPASPGVRFTATGSPETLAANTLLLLNASGYTTHFDARVNDLLGVNWPGTLNPYIDYAVDLDPGPTYLPNPNHRLSQISAPETQTFQMTLPDSGVLEFALVLEANYGQSATKATRTAPTYYLPEFNRKEAYSIKPLFPFGNSVSRPAVGSLLMRAAIADWQQGGVVDPIYPNPANTAGLRQISQVEQITVEAPTVQTGLTTVIAPLFGTGTEADPLTYSITLNRNRPRPPEAGNAPVLIIAEDTLNDTDISIPTAVADLGFTQDVRAYQIFNIQVVPTGAFTDVAPAYTKFLVGNIPAAAYPGGPNGSPDIGVYNNGGGTAGVYIAGEDNTVRRFPLWYGRDDGGVTLSSATDAGLVPLDDFGGTNPHPAPDELMPIQHLDAANDGSLMLGFNDSNFTVDPLRIAGTGLTVELPNDDCVIGLQNVLGSFRFGARIVGGAGSGGIIGAPAYGDRVRNIAEPGISLSGISAPLSWIAGGPATERDGDVVNYYLWQAPYSSSVDRVLNGNIPHFPGCLDGITPVDWDNLVAFDIGTKEVQAGLASQYLYTVTANGTLTIFNILDTIQDGRISNGVQVFQDAATINAVGTWRVVDLQLLEFDPAHPLVANGHTQAHDWVAILFDNLNPGAPGGKIRIFEFDPTGGALTSIQDLHDNAGVDPYGSLSGYQVVALDTDDAGGFIHVTMDDNGSLPDGQTFVTVIGAL